MPKMSQIHEELRVPEGHKHTYSNSFIYIDKIWRKELEILAIKHKWNTSHLFQRGAKNFEQLNGFKVLQKMRYSKGCTNRKVNDVPTHKKAVAARS